MPAHAPWLVLLLVAVAAAGCSGPKPGVVPATDAQGRYVIHMTDALRFEPAEARVPAGATVVWANGGQEPHDVAGYFGNPPKEDYPRFESPKRPLPGWSVDPGMSYNATLSETGDWTIWCHRHHEAGMKAVIHVG